MRKPWFREQNQTWYVTEPSGEQVNLGKDKEKAEEEWHKLQSAPRPDSPDAPLDVIVNEFLEHAEETCTHDTWKWYGHYLAKLCIHHYEGKEKKLGEQPIRLLKKYHITDWIRANRWNEPSRRAALGSVRRCILWAKEEGYLENSLKIHIPKLPPSESRDTLIAPEIHAKIIDQTRQAKRQRRDAPFRLFLTGLRHSGCRPGEVAAVGAVNFDAERAIWTLRRHKTAKKTRRMRIVHLSPCLRTISLILAELHPTGPIFRNSRGEKWSRSAIRQRMARLREKLQLPDGVVAYAYRHEYTTRGLEQGIPIATMATLLGTSPEVIEQHYGHLDQRTAHLKAAVHQAMPVIGGQPEQPEGQD